MKVGIIGATGRAGRLIAKEAYDRGHQITAIVIDPEHIDNPNYTVLNKSVFDLTADDLRAAEGGQLAEDDLRDAERETEEEVSVQKDSVDNCEK